MTARRSTTDFLEVRDVRECGQTLGEAGARARESAIRIALEEIGRDELSEESREALDFETRELLSVISVGNEGRRNGLYCPVYAFQVDVDRIQDILGEEREAMEPEAAARVGVALNLCSLPSRLRTDRSAFSTTLNDLMKSRLSALGFDTEMSSGSLERRMRGGCDDLGVRAAFLEDPLRTTNYLVYGRADVRTEGDPESAYGQRPVRVELSVHFLSVSDGVELVRQVSGRGIASDEGRALRFALERAVDAVIDSGITDEAVAHWEQGLDEGFVYDLLFCQVREPAGWVRHLRNELLERGEYVGTGASMVVAGENRRAWRFKAEPGEFLYPGPEFVFFLEDYQERAGLWIPGLYDVEFGVRLLAGRAYYMFGDEPGVCFEDASRLRRMR
ncbi:MAG: hypothetical protein JRG96_01300 [Deltaproteobacteria bacterium]|nr:hypothetical protein [Deltaproteobacteria bacterium]